MSVPNIIQVCLGGRYSKNHCLIGAPLSNLLLNSGEPEDFEDALFVNLI